MVKVLRVKVGRAHLLILTDHEIFNHGEHRLWPVWKSYPE